MMLRCLIVDDEPKAVDLLEVLIGQATGWQLLAKCYNGLEAIAFLKDNEVDLVFMDINMPVISGIELAALLSPEKGIVFTTFSPTGHYVVEIFRNQRMKFASADRAKGTFEEYKEAI